MVYHCTWKHLNTRFHLIGMKVKKDNDREFFDNLAENLNNMNVNKYYTCHCTGEENYNYLSNKMSNLYELKTGMTIEV